MGTSVLIALIGIGIAFTMYVRNTGLPGQVYRHLSGAASCGLQQWYIDELYDFLFVNPCKAFGRFLWKGFDVVVVDGIVNGVGKTVMAFSGVFRLMQSGLLHNYAWSMAFGVVVILGYYVFK